jgi:GLPGLI family protein
MKTILTIYGALMLSIAAYSQQADKALVKVQYNFIHVNDLTKPDKPYTENMILISGKNASLYLSYDRMDYSINYDLQSQEARKKGLTQEQFNQQQGPSKKFLTTQYYYFFRENTFYSKEDICMNGCMVDDIIEKPDWKITKDTLSFSGIHAQKATAQFKGRNWTAWFAPELPFESGPWKLNGLPGLIIEAYDDKKEVQFKFLGVENIKPGSLAVESAYKLSPQDLAKFKLWFPDLDISQVALPQEKEMRHGGYQKVTKKEFDKLKEAYDNDPTGFTRAQFAAIGVTGNISSNGSAKVDGNTGTVTIQQSVNRPATITNTKNNPIELPQKK